MAGIIPACLFVQQACKRHLDDLQRTDWPYEFDWQAGEDICEFSCMFSHIKGPLAGQLITLEGWQSFILSCVFGWVLKHNRKRRFRRVYIEMPRGNGKTTISATPALFMLAADNEGGAEVYSAARIKDQAKIAFGIAQHMARKCPEFRNDLGVDVIAHRIIQPGSASFFEAVSSDADSLDGKNVHFGLIDELHAHRSRDVYDAIETGCGKRDQALLWAITTAGSDKTGIAYEQRAYVLNILKGTVSDESYFGIVYTIDDARTETFTLTRGLEEIGNRCTCNQVHPTFIAQAWQSVTGVPTLKEKSGREECAEAATKNTFSIKTLNGKFVRSQSNLNGQTTTKTGQAQQTESGETNPVTNGPSWINSGLQNTESPAGGSTNLLNGKVGSVQYATQLAKTFAWITATAQEKFGDYSASNATLQSAFSETARRVLSGHLPICNCHKDVKVDDFGITISLPADDWTDPEIHRKANPNYGVSVEAKNLNDMCLKAKHSPASQAAFHTKHLNIWIQTDQALYDMQAWDRCKDETKKIEDYAGRKVRIAADLATKVDIAAVMLQFDEDDGSVTVFPRFYVPRAAVDETKNASYRGWEIDGNILVTEGDVIDFNTIEADIRADMEKYEVIEIGFDQWQSQQMMNSLLGDGANVIEFRQVLANFSEPTKELDSLMRQRKICHDGNPVLAWMIGNVVGHYDAKENVYPRKERPENKIDGAVALIMTLGLKLKGEVEYGSYLSTNDMLVL